jgi:hypothetical protein
MGGMIAQALQAVNLILAGVVDYRSWRPGSGKAHLAI